MDERISASENLVLNELDRVQTHLEKEVDEVRENLDEMKQFYRINKLESDNTTLLLENLVLNELDRVQTHLEKEVDEVRENLDEMKQFYRINKLESDNTTLLLQMYNNMQKEIEEIKTKIA